MVILLYFTLSMDSFGQICWRFLASQGDEGWKSVRVEEISGFKLPLLKVISLAGGTEVNMLLFWSKTINKFHALPHR